MGIRDRLAALIASKPAAPEAVPGAMNHYTYTNDNGGTLTVWRGGMHAFGTPDALHAEAQLARLIARANLVVELEQALRATDEYLGDAVDFGEDNDLGEFDEEAAQMIVNTALLNRTAAT